MTLTTVEEAQKILDAKDAENAQLRSQVERLEEQLQDEAQGGIDEAAAVKDCDDTLLARLAVIDKQLNEASALWQQHLDELGTAQQRVKELESAFRAMHHQTQRHYEATGDGGLMAFVAGWMKMANITEGN